MNIPTDFFGSSSLNIYKNNDIIIPKQELTNKTNYIMNGILDMNTNKNNKCKLPI